MGRITGRFLDWIVVASGALILVGAVLVSRAANEGRLENDLISPWHIPLYVGIFMAAYALLASADPSRGNVWRRELPDGYAIAGLGLVLFDKQNALNPNFLIRVRALRTEPDMFYVNRNLKIIEHRLFD